MYVWDARPAGQPAEFSVKVVYRLRHSGQCVYHSISIIKVLCFEPFLVHSPAAACGGCCPSCHTKGGRLLPSQSLCAHLIVQSASNESREVAIPIRSSTNVWRPPGCRSPQSRSLVQEKAGEIAFTRADSFTHPFIRSSGEGSASAARPDSIQK